MRAYYCDTFVLPLPPGHQFPMDKYRLLRERVNAMAQANVSSLDDSMHSLAIELVLPPRASDEDLLRVHCPDYLARVSNGTLSIAEQRKIGFPYSNAMAERTRRVSGATLQGLIDAISGHGIAINLAGGTHHAHYNYGAGYCVFNDSIVAARGVQARGLAKRVLIVDLDVHQGDGTARLCQDDPSIVTFSMHAAKNYPAVKARSDIDIELPNGTDDVSYLAILRQQLPRVLGLAKPDAIVYLAGADPFEQDRLGFLKLTKEGLAARDRLVMQAALARATPMVISMAGGYANDVHAIVDIHFNTVQIAAEFAAHWRQWRGPDFCGTNQNYSNPAAKNKSDN